MKTNIDLTGLVNKYLRILKLDTSAILSSLMMHIVCYVKKIRISSGNRFFGLCYMYRKMNTSITIGKNNTFRSTAYSNLIGINHKCIIATHFHNASITIGNNCGFSGTTVGAKESIKIGNNVLCGANTVITDFDWHAIDPLTRKTGEPQSSPVVIEDNVWIGMNSLILKGVTIGKNSVIGAGSVVAKSIPENVIAAGNPCKVIKPLFNNGSK